MASAIRSSTLVCVACMCFLAPTIDSTEPIYLWPFSNLTFTSEVMGGKGGKYSGNKECPELEVGHPEFSYGSFVFQRSGSYVELEMGKGRIQSITFAFFVYPYEQTGVILQYEANDHREDTVHSMTVEMGNWSVSMTMKDEKDKPLSRLVSRDRIPARQWSFIGVSKEDQTYFLQVNYAVEQAAEWSNLKFDASGDIEIAKENRAFSGRLSCLTVWNIKMLSQPEIKGWCYQSAWIRKYPNPTCPAPAPPDDVRVTHLWPLSLSSGGYNVVGDLRPTTPANFQCTFTRPVVYKANDRPVIYLDGSAVSYIEARVTAITTSDDVMVAVVIRPDSQVEGVVWDILMPTSSATDQIVRLRLSLINGFAVFEIGNAQGMCSNVTSRSHIRGNKWSLLSAMLVLSNNTMAIFSDSGLASTQLRCRLTANKAGVIRIGQPHDLQPSNVGYHGSLACLAIIDGLVDGGNIQSFVDQNCTLMDTQNRSVAKEDCADKNGIKDRRFRITAQNRCPSNDPHHLNTTSVGSLVQCSTECLSSSDCRSFAFHTTNSTDNCQLYNFVTKSGLAPEVGCKYYSVAYN